MSEVSPKYVKGGKKYGRHSRPGTDTEGDLSEALSLAMCQSDPSGATEQTSPGVSCGNVTSQQTTRDCTCSVSEFTSSSGSIHVFPYVNSLDFINKFGVSTRVYHEITRFSHDDTYQRNRTSSDPVRLMSNSFKTHDNRQNTCIHVNTHANMYWWSSTNYEPV